MMSIMFELHKRALCFNSEICNVMYACFCVSSGFPRHSVVVGEMCARRRLFRATLQSRLQISRPI